MKNLFLLIAVPALLVATGFGQTPASSSNTDQSSVKGCLAGSDGNYTLAEDGTTRTFNISSTTVDLKPHVGHDVELLGQKANVPTSSGSPDNSVAVTGLNMISDQCPTAAAATASAPMAADTTIPTTTTTTAPMTTASTPVADTITTTPAVSDTTSTTAASTPAVVDPAPVASDNTPPAADPAPVASDNTPPAADPASAETATAPMTANANTSNVNTSANTSDDTNSLPQTATSLPLIGLLGLGLIGLGLLARKSWTKQL
jgi:hypothetical protein